jgi:hypothetical protein
VSRSAKTGRELSQQSSLPYSITSSARASNVGGKVMPSFFATLKFRTNSSFADGKIAAQRERLLAI